jgi:large subunit ribosomal protein L10
MTREEKAVVIQELAEKLSNSPFFYITDASNLPVQTINRFRGLCYKRGVEFKVVKNTLLQKAMESLNEGYTPLFPALKGPTSIMFAEQGNIPARLLKEFRQGGVDKPILKAAYIDSAIYTGDDQLDALTSIKSKEELIAGIIFTLQSPARNVISALQSSGGKLAGIVKTLQERN